MPRRCSATSLRKSRVYSTLEIVVQRKNLNVKYCSVGIPMGIISVLYSDSFAARPVGIPMEQNDK